MAQQEMTPLMKQYNDVKERHPGSIVFFRLGDFYEMFGNDAVNASQLLNITLTARQNIPMCGVPYHSASNYIERLLKQGHKVAVCEQLEQPSKTKKLVKRDVVRIITPGTVVEDHFLDDKSNNYLVCIAPNKEQNAIGLTAIDISTGLFRGTIIQGTALLSILQSELEKYCPREVVMPEYLSRDKKIMHIMEERNIAISIVSRDVVEEIQNSGQHNAIITSELSKTLLYAALGIMGYVNKHYHETLSQLKPLNVYESNEFVLLSENTIKHLEIIENAYSRERKGSLLSVLDKTMTPMGARLLKQWMLEPLTNPSAIHERQKIVQAFVQDNTMRDAIRGEFKEINDTERMISRINCNANTPRDLIALKGVLSRIPAIRKILTQHDDVSLLKNDIQNFLWGNILKGLISFDDLIDRIETTIVDNPPNNLKDGGVIKDGCSDELDELRAIKRDGRAWLLSFEQKEKASSGITTLRVKFNNIFGYYIEVTKAQLSSVPAHYVRIQTLTNAERFTTEELKQYEIKIRKAETDIIRLETEIYNSVRELVKSRIRDLQNAMHSLTLIDVFSNLAEVSVRNNYTCPVVDEGYDLVIEDGRHPVVEQLFRETEFVPNDTGFSDDGCRLYLITGPNMAGKSTYLRQVALIVLMAQMGSFVPARYAKIGAVDKIFTRIGSGDKLIKGESTFLVEMKETAEIIRGATEKSLVILDEVGRGTSTFDGISLAWVIIEELVNRTWYTQTTGKNQLGPKTLFATHYFELIDLAAHISHIKNFSMAVREWNDEIVFLYKIVEGASDRSYGIHVAKIAGLPLKLVEEAGLKLHELERTTQMISIQNDDLEQPSEFDFSSHHTQNILDEIKNLPADDISPVAALLKIKEWQEQLKEKGKDA